MMSLETALLIHDNMIYLAVPVVLGFSFWYAPHYHYGKVTAITYYVVLEVMIIATNNLGKWAGDIIGLELGYQSARAFLFIPLLTLLVRPIWKIKPLHGADFFTPVAFFIRGIVIIGCAILGCSNGFPCSWGMFSPNFGYRIFPIDLIDALTTFIIGAVSIHFAKKWNYQANGRVFALAMICLGIVRFCLQFASRDYWWIRGFNDDSVYSILSIIIGFLIFRMESVSSIKANCSFQNGGE